MQPDVSQNVGSKVFTFNDFLSSEECEYWLTRAPRPPKSDLVAWEGRVVDISQEPIVHRVKKYVESELNVALRCTQAQIQCWPAGSGAALHIHDCGGRESTDYNSLIYLNENFRGGQFFTENSKISPRKGLLTFFDGRRVPHGVKRVQGADRFTLIFWWANTRFL